MSKHTWAWTAALLGLSAQAQMSPVGLWRSIDDETHQPKAEIRISQNTAGGLSGVVEKSLQNNPNTDPNCNLCTDDRKGKPKIGLEIIRGGQQSDGKNMRRSAPIRSTRPSCRRRVFTSPASCPRHRA